MEDMAMNTNDVTDAVPPNPFMSGSNTARKAVDNENEQPTENLVVAPEDQDLIEDKKLKRVLASREYSKNYRQKKMNYKAKLEAEVRALQAHIDIIAPRKTYLDSKKTLLLLENNSLKQQLSAFTGKLGVKKTEYAELKQERENLKQLYAYQQQMQQNNQNSNFQACLKFNAHSLNQFA